jgi:hypothetical protein
MNTISKTSLIAGLAFLGLAATQPASADDRRIQLDNESGNIVVSFYASDVGSASWEGDILGARVLFSGHFARVNLNEGSDHCYFDFKTRFSNGSTVVRRNVNVCRLDRYTLSD